MSYANNPDTANYGFTGSFGDSTTKTEYDYGDDGGAQPLQDRDGSNSVDQSYQDTNGLGSIGSRGSELSFPEAHVSNKKEDFGEPYGSSFTTNGDIDGSDRKSSANAQNGSMHEPFPSTNQGHHKSPLDPHVSSNNNDGLHGSSKREGSYGSEDTQTSGPHGSHNNNPTRKSVPATNDPPNSNDDSPDGSLTPTPSPHAASSNISENNPDGSVPNPAASEASDASEKVSSADLYANFDSRHKPSSKTHTGTKPSHVASHDEPHESGRHAPSNTPSHDSSIPDPDADSISASDQPPTHAGAGAGAADWLHKGVMFAAQKTGHAIDDDTVAKIEGGLKKLGLDNLF